MEIFGNKIRDPELIIKPSPIRANWSLIFERPNRIERERREKERRRRGRGRGRERKEIKQAKIKGMELHGLLKLGIVFHTTA